MSFVSNPALDQVRLQLQVKDNIIRNLAEELSDAKQALTIREQWWRDQFSSAQQEHDAAQQEALDDGTPPLPPPSAASSSASLEKALTATSSSENQAREEAAHLRGELARLQERSEALLRESTALARREREHRLVEEELARQAEMAETKAAEANRQVCEEQERRREEEERRRDAEERRREAEERRREAEEKLENLQDLEGALVAAREQEGALEGELSAVQEEARGWRDEMERMSAELEQGLVREEKLREGMVLLEQELERKEAVLKQQNERSRTQEEVLQTMTQRLSKMEDAMHRNAEAQVTAAHEKAEELRLDLGDARVSGERATARVRTLENQVITMSQSMEQQETKFQLQTLQQRKEVEKLKLELQDETDRLRDAEALSARLQKAEKELFSQIRDGEKREARLIDDLTAEKQEVARLAQINRKMMRELEAVQDTLLRSGLLEETKAAAARLAGSSSSSPGAAERIIDDATFGDHAGRRGEGSSGDEGVLVGELPPTSTRRAVVSTSEGVPVPRSARKMKSGGGSSSSSSEPRGTSAREDPKTSARPPEGGDPAQSARSAQSHNNDSVRSSARSSARRTSPQVAKKSSSRRERTGAKGSYRIVPVYGQTFYQAVANDETDAKLARWINKRDHSKILFSRIGAGRYLYGRLEVQVAVSRSVKNENLAGHLIVTVSNADTRSGIEVLPVEDFVRRHEDREFQACEREQRSDDSAPPEPSNISKILSSCGKEENRSSRLEQEEEEIHTLGGEATGVAPGGPVLCSNERASARVNGRPHAKSADAVSSTGRRSLLLPPANRFSTTTAQPTLLFAGAGPKATRQKSPPHTLLLRSPPSLLQNRIVAHDPSTAAGSFVQNRSSQPSPAPLSAPTCSLGPPAPPPPRAGEANAYGLTPSPTGPQENQWLSNVFVPKPRSTPGVGGTMGGTMDNGAGLRPPVLSVPRMLSVPGLMTAGPPAPLQVQTVGLRGLGGGGSSVLSGSSVGGGSTPAARHLVV